MGDEASNLGASDLSGDSVASGSKIENIRGGAGGDELFGCAGKNTLSGNGGMNMLSGYGGTTVGGVAIPESSDVYGGFRAEAGAFVVDGGGEDDLVDLAAFTPPACRCNPTTSTATAPRTRRYWLSVRTRPVL